MLKPETPNDINASFEKDFKEKFIKILHIDDDKAFLNLTKIYLEDLSSGSLHIDSLTNPDQFSARIEENTYDLVISDYQMEPLNGLQLLEALRSRNNFISFIMFTGKGREEVAVDALNLGADRYIKKGYDDESQYTELYHAIKDIIKRKRLEGRYQTIFEESSNPLIEEDFSGIKTFIDKIKGSGIRDIGHYFETHTDQVAEAASTITIIDANQATLDLYKAKNKEYLTEHFSEILTPHAYNTFVKTFIAFAKGKTKFRAETVNLTLEGNKIDIIVDLSIPRGFEKTFSKVLISIIDITDHNRAENARRDSNLKYQMLFEDSPISLMEQDWSGIKQYLNNLEYAEHSDLHAYLDQHPEAVRDAISHLKIININQATLTLFDATSRDHFLSNIHNLFLSETIDQFKEEMVAISEGTMQFSNEKIAKTLTGHTIHLIIGISISPMYEETWSRVLVSFQNITVQKTAEAQIIRTAQHFQELAELAHMLAQSSTNFEVLLPKIVQRVAERFQDFCSVMLLSKDGLHLETTVNHHPDPDFKAYVNQILRKFPPQINEGLMAKVFQTGKPFIVSNTSLGQIHDSIKQEYRSHLDKIDIRSFMMFPLMDSNYIFGVLIMARHKSKIPYTSEEQIHLRIMSEHIAQAVINARLVQQIQKEKQKLQRSVTELEEINLLLSHDLQEPIRTTKAYLSLL